MDIIYLTMFTWDLWQKSSDNWPMVYIERRKFFLQDERKQQIDVIMIVNNK